MTLIFIVLAVILVAVVALLIVRRPATPSGGDSARDSDARRFAKLLVAEIRIHNPSQVEEGRRNKDLYRRLRKEVDRARRMYDERVDSGVTKRADYFHDELVKELAGGDVFALGEDYRRG